jgi:hypothetical protein
MVRGMIVKSVSFARSLLLASAVVAVSVFTSVAWAQEADGDTAYIPFVVNVDATVEAFVSCIALYGVVCPRASMQVSGGEEAILKLSLSGPTGVRFSGAQKQAGVPLIISGNGKVSVNLPAESYKSAEVSLFAVNGKRILRGSVDVASASNMAIRRSVAPGMYLLSVKCDGGAVTSKLMHGGGRLDIDVAFGREKVVSGVNRQSKAAARGAYLNISVNAVGGGYVDSSYSFYVVSGVNSTQNITLRERE